MRPILLVLLALTPASLLASSRAETPRHPAAAAAPAPQAAKVPAGTILDPAKSFDAMLSNFEAEFTGAAKAMPAAKYSFAPTPAIFVSSQAVKYESVKTFAQEVTHVAEANYYYASAFSGLKPDFNTDTLAKITDKDQALAALAASFVFAHKAVATLTPANAFESVHAPSTRASLAGGLVAHGFDHYGQIVEYLRMNAIIPPASAK